MTKKKKEKITTDQQELFLLICNYLECRHVQPTLRILGEDLGIVVSAVNARLQALIEKGYIRSEGTGTRDRILSIGPKGIAVRELIRVPILGTIACGVPIWAEQNFDGDIVFERGKLGDGNFFALKARGESMINADIQDKDLVIIRQQPMANSGEIIAAYLDGEVTLKRFDYKDDVITLLAENPNFAPIAVASDANFRILGVFQFVSRVVQSFAFQNNF